MNIYETFNNLRYHYENEVVEFKKAENSFSFDDLGKYFSALSNEANTLSNEAIKFLRSKKYIEGRMPKVYVSKQVAQVTDQKAEYSMHKGLEYKKCKALLQDALEDHKFLTREDIDKLWWNLLSDVLSDKQKKAKVGNMLTKMREERIIVNETKGNVSVWSLLKTKK